MMQNIWNKRYTIILGGLGIGGINEYSFIRMLQAIKKQQMIKAITIGILISRNQSNLR